MRLSLVLVLVVLALVVICECKPAKKHSKSKDHAVKKSSKPAKVNHSKTSKTKHETAKKSKAVEKKGKIAKPKKEKTRSSKNKDKKSSKAKDKMMKSKTPKKNETKSDKSVKIESSAPKENLKNIPKNCDNIVQQYADGQMVMYEYKIKMAKCLKAEKSSKSPGITSKYENDDESNEDFFRKSLKYAQDEDEQTDDNDSYSDSDNEEKKSVVPTSDLVNAQPSMDTSAPQQQAASYYPSQDQSSLDQVQAAPAQPDAAFSQNAMYNQAAPVQQNYNYYARSNVPAAPQAQDANQQWNAANVAAPAQAQVDATKKDTLPAAPANDPFAQFMNIQSSSNTAPQPIQQRSDIPSDQSYNTVPANQQAYFRQQYRFWSPEDDGIFPENP